MAKFRCPGQDLRLWKPEDISEHRCPHCGLKVEFWKDDVDRPCPHCGRQMHNPRFNPGCAEWCAYADDCAAVNQPAPDSPSKRPPKKQPHK